MWIRTFALTLLAAFAVIAIGATASAQTPPAAAPVAAGGTIEPSIVFAGGDARTLALRNNGDVLTWGNQGGHCSHGRQAVVFKTDPTPGVVMHSVKEIAAAGLINMALTVDGKV